MARPVGSREQPYPASHEQPLRDALLTRLVAGLARITEEPRDFTPDCCWLNYSVQEHGRDVPWIRRICPDDCAHAHHRHEIFSA